MTYIGWLTLALLATAAEPPHEEVVVVVHESNPQASISVRTIRRMVLGQTTAWSSLVPVTVVMRPLSSHPATAVLEDLLRLSVDAYARRREGPVVSTAQRADDVVRRVSEEPGAIGFVLSSEIGRLPPGVKALRVA